ncbi:hypothetical protein B5F07_18475 [Lachnoclostridium sp. An169]|uniref:hypothetical protein n=1 Tax=Lachnoclostridium sp. An169 TaxID=1965569 RepID=UPI000B398605|nr:hypothetical protein [Lachnoclostridium sp. An169]OUP81223.1 hypothetical protein B5F07_18475 [Lachnoclostridium sp. An169]
MEPFIKVFGEISLATAVYFIAAAVFLWAVYRKCRKEIIKQYAKKKKEKEQLQRILAQVEQYPKWREQSIEIQKQYNKEIAELKERQEKNIQNVKELQEELNRREASSLRNQMLTLYRYYSSTKKNPMQAWSKMESKAFWDMYEDYRRAGGNGHMETVVKPVMNTLEVIEMKDTERLKELMETRA